MGQQGSMTKEIKPFDEEFANFDNLPEPGDIRLDYSVSAKEVKSYFLSILDSLKSNRVLPDENNDPFAMGYNRRTREQNQKMEEAKKLIL